MADALAARPHRGFWIVAILALIWNLLGVATYLMTVSMSEAALAEMPEAEQRLYTDTPVWVTAAYAIAVFGGTLASLGLLLRKNWAVPLFTLSLIAILVQMGHGLFMSALIEVRGASAAVLPLTIIVIAVFLLAYGRSAKAKGWIGP